MITADVCGSLECSSKTVQISPTYNPLWCRSHKIWRSRLRRRPLKAGPTPEGLMASICAPAVRSTCSTLHLSIVRKHAPPQPRATPTNFAPTDLLKLAVGHQLYDVIVISNPDIDAGHVNLTPMRLHFPPPSPPHSHLICFGLYIPPDLFCYGEGSLERQRGC